MNRVFNFHALRSVYDFHARYVIGMCIGLTIRHMDNGRVELGMPCID